ncbi:MAG: hypothetical protein KBF21_17080 [Thermoanaerobaculia bacterium]|nr:hypothetical protein [Thermoanaerobaculia bacterium]
MTLRLADVCDLDCVATLSPLVIDLPDAERYARGWAAIARRVLYAWALAGILDLEGASTDDGALIAIRSQCEALAEGEDYVLSASVDASLDGDALTLPAALLLVDGQTYRFSVTTGAAATLTFEDP